MIGASIRRVAWVRPLALLPWLLVFAAPGDEVGRLRAETADLRAQLTKERAKVRRLTAELNQLGDRWATRELDLIRLQREWAAWQEGGVISEGLRALLGLPPSEAEASDESPQQKQEDEPDPDVARAAELRLSLETLLRLEGVGSLNPFNLGRVLRTETGDPNGVGPVLMRMFDAQHRPAGVIAAERLTLEASRTGHTLTLVFEQGTHSRNGTRLPFHNGVHRTTLRHVDPTPFFERTPELFAGGAPPKSKDDGLWSHAKLSFELNRLLAADASADRYRLEYFDGISGTDWIDVELSVRDGEGRGLRRLFADRMRITIPAGEGQSGVRIELTDGVSIRGDEQIPFLDGRLRLLLPRADLGQWRGAQLPGLSEPNGDDRQPPRETRR